MKTRTCISVKVEVQELRGVARKETDIIKWHSNRSGERHETNQVVGMICLVRRGRGRESSKIKRSLKSLLASERDIVHK